jgi:hypothetical protein
MYLYGGRAFITLLFFCLSSKSATTSAILTRATTFPIIVPTKVDYMSTSGAPEFFLVDLGTGVEDAGARSDVDR